MTRASPNTATVATLLERYLGIIADVAEMTSESTVGITRISLQFNLNRSLAGASRKRMVTALGRSCAGAGGRRGVLPRALWPSASSAPR
jgi:hypothetical protein